MSGRPRTLLGFDFGTRRIGVAVGQELTRTATALVTLTSRDGGPDWAAIGRLIEEWQPAALVVGLPLNLDGSESESSRLARRFGNRLAGRYNLPVFTVDERLSSSEAEALLAERGRFDKADIDKLAAQLILQGWLEANNGKEI
ncbi:MAG: Holliday junction resolvase RuvX [Gammaproteobacteria bacterium]|nr:Holliday junction resolvase RuvX [Gammaproteobacteria bacterium]